MSFFDNLERKVKSLGRGLEDVGKDIIGFVGGAVDDVASAIARPFGVHPDVVKVAAAALGIYDAAGGFVTAAGEAVAEAAAADLIAAHGADALVASNQIAAAAELAAATGTVLPYAVDPAMLVSQLAAEGSVASAAHIASTAGVSTAPIVDSLIASGQYDAAAQLTMATNPMELGFVNQKIGLAKTAADTATASPVIASPLAAPSVLASDTLGASLSGLTAEQIAAATSANALAPTAAATGAGVANALSPEALAAYDASVGLTAGGGPATLSPEALAAYDASVGLTAGTGAGAGAAGAGAAGAGTNALVGYGGAGDVLNPVTGAVIPGAGAAALTGAGLAGAAGAGALGASALVPLALAGTGVLGAITARNAAETQADAARYASDQAYKIYQEQKALAEPFRTAGIGAQNQLLTLLGLPGGTQGAEFGRYARPFGMQDFQADPGYAFRLSEGMKALEASRAAKGGLLSGATGKALSRYGQDLASQEYGSAFNRYQTERANRLAPLGSLTSMGQAAAAGQAGYAGQYGANVGNLATSGAAAQAAGQVGMTNALTGALNTYLNYSANQNLANALQDAAVRRASMYGPAIPV